MRRARGNGRGRVKLGPVCLTGSDDVSQTGAWTPRNQGRTLPYQVPGFGGRAVHITPLVVDSLYLNPKQSVSSPSRNSYPFLFCFSSVMVVLNLKPLSQLLKPSKPLRGGGALVMIEEAVTVVCFVEIVELDESNLRSTCWQLLPSCRPTFYERCDCQEQKQHITYLPILHTISEARCSIMCYASCYLPCIIKYPRSRVAYLIRVW